MATIPRQVAEIDPLAILSSSRSPDFPSRTPESLPITPNISVKNLNNEFTEGITSSKSQSTWISPKINGNEAVRLCTEEFLHKCRTTPLDASAVVPNPSGIQLLARTHAWEHVVVASAKLITREQPGFSSGVLSLVMKLRLEGLFRMKMFDELLIEANKIIQYEDNRLKPLFNEVQSNSVLNCDLLVAMKLLVAEVTAMMGRYEESLESLYTLKSQLSQYDNPSNGLTIANASFWIWKARNGIVNASIRQRHWRIALSELLSMSKDIKILQTKNPDHDKRLFIRPLIILYSRISRTFLQMGNIQCCDEFFSQALNLYESIKSQHGASELLINLEEQITLAKALILFSKEEYAAAMECFSALIAKEGIKQRSETLNALSFFSTTSTDSNNMFALSENIQNDKTFDYFPSIFIVEESIFAVAANNYAICALNLRKIKEAVNTLESLIQEDPSRYLNDALAFNLCTLYDLTCPPELGTTKKKSLHAISLMFNVGEPVINWKSFRLS